MTIPPLTGGRVQILGDGATGRVDLDFQFVDEKDLLVIHTDADGVDTEWAYQQSPGNWFFTGGSYAAGTVFFTPSDLGAGERLTVTLVSDYRQPFSLEGGEIDPDVIERAMDRTALSVQAIAGRVSRSLSVSPSLEGQLPDLQVPDLPDGYGFVRQGSRLVPALIDSTAISVAVSVAEDAKDGAVAARDGAVTAQDASQTAAGESVTAKDLAVAAKDDAVAAKDAAEQAQALAEDAVDDVITGAAEVLGSGRVPVGFMAPWFSLRPPNQYWVLVDRVGQVFSRALFPQLFDALAPEFDVSFSDGDPVVAGIVCPQRLKAGRPVEGENIPAGTTILSVDSPSQITLSADPTGDGTKIRIFPHGNGDGATTANYPAVAGRVVRGLDSDGVLNPEAENALGETQEDALQQHVHLAGVNDDNYGGNSGGGNTVVIGPSVQGIGPYTTGWVYSDAGVRVSETETRAKAVIAPYIIKVADGVDDEATLSALQVVQDLAQAQADIAALQANSGEAALLAYQQPSGVSGGNSAATSERKPYVLN
ncbi:hypothetical protein FMN50_01460, partial [Rhodobacterales bacterium]